MRPSARHYCAECGALLPHDLPLGKGCPDCGSHKFRLDMKPLAQVRKMKETASIREDEDGVFEIDVSKLLETKCTAVAIDEEGVFHLEILSLSRKS